MGIPVLVMGASGSGKSTSMRTFKPGEVGIINVSGKPLPFRSEMKPFNSDSYEQITAALKKASVKSLVIDDAQYLMANEYMRAANQTGYQKFTDIAVNFWTLIQTVVKALPDDSIVYFLSHTDTDAGGFTKMKTIGKMLDEKITIEGLFTIVLRAAASDGRYVFRTQTDGADTAKSPMGLFAEMEIGNDLKAVDDAIREYYGIKTKMEEKK